MFSLHIDTARGWRGGQSQVLHTVLGLRAIGASRGARGASRRRAAAADERGTRPDPDRRARRGGPLGGVAAVARHQAAGARRDSRARPARRRDGLDRAVDPVADAEAAARRVAAHRVADGEELVLALEVLADRLLHRQQRRHPRSAGGRRDSAREDDDRARRRGRRAHRAHAGGQRHAASSTCRRTRRSSATWRRSFHTRDITT